MPPRRFMLPPKQKKKEKPQPVTAEDFYHQGVEFEESGERWRSGDKLKSGRFFHKALDAYETSLRLSPADSPYFDSAYNAARVQLILAEDHNYHETGLTKEQKLGLLRRAVEVHYRAIAIAEKIEEKKQKRMGVDNLLYNAGQAMTSYADLMVGASKRLVRSDREEVIRVLGEAFTVFTKVWEMQERIVMEQGLLESSEADKLKEEDLDEDQFTPTTVKQDSPVATFKRESLAPHAKEDCPDIPGDASSMESEPESEWAYVEEPITIETLLDTASQTLAALTIRAQIIPLIDEDPAATLSEIRSISEPLINTKLIPLVTRAPKSSSEVLLCRANFLTALAEASFRCGLITAEAYESELLASFALTPNAAEPTHTGLDFKHFQTLCDKADTHIAFAHAVSEVLGEEAHGLAWKHYYHASQSLLCAAAIEKSEPKIQLGRGDIELLRSKLSVKAAQRSQEILRRNAAVYYRGAKALANKDVETRLEACVKEAMLAYEDGDDYLLRELGINGKIKVLAAEAVSEGLFGQEWLQRLGITEA